MIITSLFENIQETVIWRMVESGRAEEETRVQASAIISQEEMEAWISKN